MSDNPAHHGRFRRVADVPRGRRAAALALIVAGAAACALFASAAPAPAHAAKAPKLIATYNVNSVTCVPGPSNTVRAQVKLWMRVVNYDGLGEWASNMEAKARLEPTTAGVNYTRRWSSSKTPNLVQNKKHRYNMNLLTDTMSGTAEWRVHVKLIWDRPAPIKNVTRDVYLTFSNSCATSTGGGGGALPPPAQALPSAGAG